MALFDCGGSAPPTPEEFTHFAHVAGISGRKSSNTPWSANSLFLRNSPCVAPLSKIELIGSSGSDFGEPGA
jgi:hypothetical protein